LKTAFCRTQFTHADTRVKNPVRKHGASSMEKAIYIWGLLANGIRWSANGIRWSADGIRWSANGIRWSANGRRWSANGRRWSAPPNHTAIHPSSEERGILAFSRNAQGHRKT
jgi:hypothetical protein